MTGPTSERCKAVLAQMQEREDAKWFAQPVSEADVPDYESVIATPMDYSTVSGKLESSAYAAGGPLAFAADMRLIFTNALAYNWDCEQQCHIAAKQVCAEP